MFGYQAIVTNLNNGRVLSARCSACNAELDVATLQIPAGDPDGKLQDVLDKHVGESHAKKGK